MTQESLGKKGVLKWVLEQRQVSFSLVLGFLILALVLFWIIYHLTPGAFGAPEPMSFRAISLATMGALAFLLYPIDKRPWNKSFNVYSVIDILLALLFVGVAIHIIRDPMGFVLREGNPTTLDLFWGLVLVVLLLELTRRTFGWALVLIATAFVAYALFANYVPGVFNAPAVTLPRLINGLFVRGTAGIYGIAMGAMSNYISLFLIFGSLLLVSGGGEWFKNIALALTGKTKGGPAKVAVISSALMGTVTGSAVANVATTGAFTIPLMKSTGFNARYAGAVETVASTGGQIMPPIMGASAFVMAEYLSIPYIQVAKYALIPAILFFLAVFVSVDLEAKRMALDTMTQTLRSRDVLREGWYYLVPLVLIIVILLLGYTPQRAAFIGVIAMFILCFINKKTKLTTLTFFEALEEAAKNAVGIGVATGVVGVIIGCIEASGIGVRFTTLVLGLAGSYLIITLLLVALVAIVLGMGVPTVAVYVTVAALLVPLLVEAGVVPAAAHLFALYFGVLSLITPPVCPAAFPAAGIAGEEVMRVGLTAVRIGLPCFIIPFSFAFGPQLLMIGSPWAILQAFITAAIGVIAFASSLQGWLLTKASVVERLMLGVAAVSLIFTEVLSDVLGLCLVAAVLFWQLMKRRSTGKEFLQTDQQ